MARNKEIIRQWGLLKAIEASRYGVTIPDLAAEHKVHTRTIRRDLAALQEVGFPIYDDVRDGKKFWLLNGQALRGLERSGFTLSETCALYFSRSLLEKLAGAPFRDNMVAAFDKVAAVLTPAMKAFLDKLPAVLEVKSQPLPRTRRSPTDAMADLIEASLDHRCVQMRYHSVSSNRTKDYHVQPHKVVYGQGALYLLAFVPEYGQIRTFAVDRIETLTVLEETFEPVKDVTVEILSHSIGIHVGPPSHVVLQFEPRIAPYIRERTWHKTQGIEDTPEGGIRLTLDVCDDWALRTWILGFGSLVRVIAPRSLAEYVLAEINGARLQYTPRMEFDVPRAKYDPRGQRLLPFRRARMRRASPSRHSPTRPSDAGQS